MAAPTGAIGGTEKNGLGFCPYNRPHNHRRGEWRYGEPTRETALRARRWGFAFAEAPWTKRVRSGFAHNGDVLFRVGDGIRTRDIQIHNLVP